MVYFDVAIIEGGNIEPSGEYGGIYLSAQ